jgi:hypothetical protein
VLASAGALAVSMLVTMAPTNAFAAQPSEFSPAPEPAPQSPAPPPPPGPMVPPKPEPPPGAGDPSGASPDANSGASPPVAGAVPPPKTTAPPAAPAEAPKDPVIEAMADVPHFGLGAGGAVAFGSAPEVAVGVRASAEIATGRWSLGIEGRYDLPASARTAEGGRARSSLAGGSFVPCFRAKGTWACGVVLASRVAIDGTSASGASASDASFFLGVGARLEMHLSLPLDFALRIVGEILAHPIAYELVAGAERVFKSSVVSASLGPMLVRAF